MLETPPKSAGIMVDFMIPMTNLCVTVCLSLSGVKKVGGERASAAFCEHLELEGERCSKSKVKWPEKTTAQTQAKPKEVIKSIIRSQSERY